MKISPIWRNALGIFAVCLGPAIMVLGIAIFWLDDHRYTEQVFLGSLYGAVAAVLIGVFTRRVLAIVLGALALFITIAIPGLLRACCGGNEGMAIGSLRSINSAQSTYSSSCGGEGYAQSLESHEAAGRIDGGLHHIGSFEERCDQLRICHHDDGRR